MSYLLVGDYVYALTPGQKSKKKDYLYKKEYESGKDIPSWEEVWEEIKPTFDMEEEAYYLLHVWEDIEDEEEREKVKQGAYEEVFADLENQYLDQYEEATYQLDNLEDVEVWRIITVEEGVDPTKLEGLGIFWAYEESAAEAHWGHSKGVSVLFHAKADPRSVDYAGTVWARTMPGTGDAEKEIRFIKHAPVYVYEVEFVRGPRRGEVIEINDWRRA